MLYEQNAHEERLIASITKLMTALVALESGHDLEETVTSAAGGLDPGRGLLPLSAARGGDHRWRGCSTGCCCAPGNDAALAVAELLRGAAWRSSLGG